MKVTFIYNNGKMFTASNVDMDSLIKENGKVKYMVNRAINGDVMSEVVKAFLPSPENTSGITSKVESEDLLDGIDCEQYFTIDVKESGLEYMVLKQQFEDYDMLSQFPGGLVVIPVSSKSLQPQVLADAVALML